MRLPVVDSVRELFGGKPDRARGLSESGRFQVGRLGSLHRRQPGADYLACVEKTVIKELGLDGHVVAIRRFDSGESCPSGKRPPELRARCRLTVCETDAHMEEEVMLDQTVRNALGIPYEDPEAYRVDVAPLKRTLRAALSDRLGVLLLRRRAVFMRVCSADPSDMEKELTRIPTDVFPLLGASPGQRLVISHPVLHEDRSGYREKKRSLQAHPLTETIVERRRREETPGLYDRYPDATALFGVTPDLAPIYLDEQARGDLGDVRSLEVVRVRRDDLNAFFNDIRTFGLAVVAASVAVAGVFPIDEDPWRAVAVLAVALLAAAVVSIFNLRGGRSSSVG
jgi:hypothetical protein